MYVCVHVCIHVCVLVPRHAHGGHRTTHGESVLSFHHVCTGNQSQVIKLGGKCLYLLTRGPILTDSNTGEGGAHATVHLEVNQTVHLRLERYLGG